MRRYRKRRGTSSLFNYRKEESTAYTKVRVKARRERETE
jgi:hypothetical protein